MNLPKRPKMDITSVLTPQRDITKASRHASARARSRDNTEILHVYMPTNLKNRFRRLQAELLLERGETWKLSEIARAVLSIGLDAGEEEIVQLLLDQAQAS